MQKEFTITPFHMLERLDYTAFYFCNIYFYKIGYRLTIRPYLFSKLVVVERVEAVPSVEKY